MNYKRISKALKSCGLTKETDRLALVGIIKAEEKIQMEKAIVLMLAAPMNVLMEEWGDEAKEKAPKFCEDCLSIIESWSVGGVTYEELCNYIYEESGVDINALWVSDGSTVDMKDIRGENEKN